MIWYGLVPLVCFEGRADVALGMRGIIFSGGILIMREGGGLWIISEAIVTRRDSSFVTVQPSSAYVGRLERSLKSGCQDRSRWDIAREVS